MKFILKKYTAIYKAQKFIFGSSISIASALTLITAGAANAQVGIDSLNATYQNGTSSSYSTTVGDPCNTGNYSGGCNSNINMQFGVGTTNDLILSGFTAQGDSYSLVRLTDEVVFRRIDGQGATGERNLVFFEYNTNNQIRSSYTNTMAGAMLGTIINRGVDNGFSNDDSVASNNIERIDYIIAGGMSVPGVSANDIGFLVLERNGNDPFQIAAITSLDASGKPNGFGPLRRVNASTWGGSGFNVRTAVMRREENESNFRPSHLVGNQEIHAVYTSIGSLGLTTGQTFYGYALFPNDIDQNNDLINLTDFPTDTSGASGEGGLDLMAGGGIFIKDGLTTVSGRLYEDSDGDDNLDGNEANLPANITVRLLDNNDNQIATDVTDSNGDYEFIGVANGNYKIQVDTNDSDIPAGYTLGTPNDLSINVLGSPVTNQNFGFDVSNIGGGIPPAPYPTNVCFPIADGGGGNGGNDWLTRLSKISGNETAVGTGTGTNNIEASALQPITGTFYAVNQNRLGTIDFETGVFTSGANNTGRLRDSSGNQINAGNVDIDGMSFDPTESSNDVLYASVRTANEDVLIKIDIATGRRVRNAFLNGTSDYVKISATDGLADIDAIAAGIDGKLYGVANQGGNGAQLLVEINKQTGATTKIGNIGNGLDIEGLSIDYQGKFYATSGNGRKLYELNPANAQIIQTWNLGVGNDYETVACRLSPADLGITKTVDKPNPNPSETIKYNLTVTNNGQSIASDVEVTDSLPAGVTYSSDNPSKGSYDSNTGIWKVGVLETGQSATLEITATVNNNASGTITNDATVTNADQPDDNSANNTDNADITIPSPSNDLTVSGTVYEDFGAGGDNNNTFDNGEGTIGNVTVELFADNNSDGQPDGAAIKTVVTDATTGDYQFTQVASGNYLIRVNTRDTDIPSSYAIGTPNPIQINVSSDIVDQDFGFNTVSKTCPSGSFLPEQTFLDFRNPQLVSGNALSLGAIYRFSNVATDVDALVEIKSFNNATLAQIDRNDFGIQSAFQPEVRANSTNVGEYSVDFDIQFVQSGTSTPVELRKILATGIDIDGDNVRVREASELGGNRFTSYAIDSDSRLTATELSSTRVKFESTTTFNLANITINSLNQGSAFYDNSVEKIEYRAGLIIDPGNATNIANQRLTSLVFDCVEYNLAVTNTPNVILVKRITAINGNRNQNPNDGTPLNQFVDDTSSPQQGNDNSPNWPDNYLLGAINGGKIKPDDEIEYTIYFLNIGNGDAADVRVCDRITNNQNFQPDTYAVGRGIQLKLGNSAQTNLTNVNDNSDRAQLITPGGVVPGNCNIQGANSNGTVQIDITGNTGSPSLSTMPGSTGKGTPNNSYGLFRFRTKVQP
ncbi:MAG: DUF11 domain-containing protein [Rivularia sp. (in: Bacteria)]|nr:DUF11 domain-containing protein [Rivularia sp. MS3]